MENKRTSQDALSFLSPIGYTNSSNCGYCGSKGSKKSESSPRRKARYSYYATAISLTPEFYQSLLDRTWRRSGRLLYRPNPRASCCPHYTLRLEVKQYSPTKDQRQAVNRFNRHILGDDYTREAARLYPRSRKEAKKRDNTFVLIERVHEAEHEHLQTPPEPAHRFDVTLEDDGFTEEKYLLFENYQVTVHKEEPDSVTRAGFTKFLCTSPIVGRTETLPDGTMRKLGSFHQCYRLDDVLVAVGVIDILPNSVSAVYFFYHESIHPFCPGKVGAVREIALAKENGMPWWYPGFYIHTCPKMRYKIDYAPQFLLDPESMRWEPLDARALRILDKNAYVSITRELEKLPEAQNGDGAGENPQRQPQPEPEPEPEPEEDDLDDDTLMSDEEGPEGSLFTRDMPGIAPLSEMMKVDLDHIALRLDPDGPMYKTSNLVVWGDLRLNEAMNIKVVVAELMAAIGVDLMDKVGLDFSSRR